MTIVRPRPARLEIPEKIGLARAVEGTGRLVENEDQRVAEERPGDRDELPLTHREPDAAGAQDGIIAVGQPLDRVVNARELRGRHDPGGRPARAPIPILSAMVPANSWISCGTVPTWPRYAAGAI